jgi:thymidylate kinase
LYLFHQPISQFNQLFKINFFMSNSIYHADNQFIKLAGVVAVVGCDGTGKSTLTADLLTYLQKKGPAKRCYLGLVSGEMGEKIKQLPFVGVQLEHYLAKKAQRAQDMKQKLPGTGTAIIMHILTYWRITQLLRVARLSKRGVLVVADRYPQAEIAGFHYDGPGITAQSTDNWLLRKLATREQVLYTWMSTYQPDLIIRLNVDAETAYARKPDHSITELREKSAVMPRLNFNGANVVDIDARMPYADVLQAALMAVNAHVKTHV